MGLALLRLPPELRSGHGADDQQGNEGMGAVPRFLDAVQLTKDVTDITDAARGKTFSNFMMAMALLKNYKPFQGPKGLKLYDLFKKFDKTWALTKARRRNTARHLRTARTKTP